MALGAHSRSVIWLVMKEVLLLLAIGLAVGVPSALALGRFVAAQLYGIKATDPWIAAASILLLTVVAMHGRPDSRAPRQPHRSDSRAAIRVAPGADSNRFTA